MQKKKKKMSSPASAVYRIPDEWNDEMTWGVLKT